MNYGMSPETFMKEVIRLYHEARITKFPTENIVRGRSASISSALEDLFAIYLAKNIQGQHTLYVDQCMKFLGESRYPDVAIQKENGDISNLFDVKADLGWKRHSTREFCQEWDDRIRQVQGVDTTFKLGTTKESKTGRFTSELKYHVVIMTAKNASKTLNSDLIWVNNNLQNVRIYVLSDGIHPNQQTDPKGVLLSQDEVFKAMHINTEHFNQLLRILRS